MLPSSTLGVAIGCWRHEAVCRVGHAFPIFIFWNDCLEFTRFSGKHAGSAPQGGGWFLHVSPRLAPSKGAKLCTYFAWFFRPSQLRFEPYLDIPMSISRLRLLMQLRMGSHSLPVEQGRLARPMVPRQLRRCTLCSTHAIGDERHYASDCPHFAHIRRQFRSLFQDADGAMQLFMWHWNQKAVCHCLAAILTLADDSSRESHYVHSASLAYENRVHV